MALFVKSFLKVMAGSSENHGLFSLKLWLVLVFLEVFHVKTHEKLRLRRLPSGVLKLLSFFVRATVVNAVFPLCGPLFTGAVVVYITIYG